MRTDRKTLLHDLSALVALLRREAGRNFHDLMTSPCSHVFKYLDEGSPTGIGNTLRQMVILEHAVDVQVLNTNMLISFSVRLRSLKQEVSSLALDLQMRLGDIARCLAPSLAALLTSAEGALFASEGAQALAIMAWVGNRVPLRICQKDFQAHIQANIRMRTRASALLMRLFGLYRLTHDQSVPVPIGTQDEMARLRRSLYRAVHLDFQGQSHFRRDAKMLPIGLYAKVFDVLAQLYRVPAVGRLETWEATGDALLLERQIASQGFVKPVSKHLYRCGWYGIAPTPLKLRRQVILKQELPCLGILLLRGFQHLVVQAPRVFQAGH